MEEEQTDPGIDETEFLLQRYGQLCQQHANKNQIIHTTFYLSVIFFGILLGAVTQLSSREARSALYLFAAFIFFSMLLWTRTYENSRKELQLQENAIIQELKTWEFGFQNSDSVEAFIASGQVQDTWEKRKEIILQIYYLSLSIFAIVILIADWLGVAELFL